MEPLSHLDPRALRARGSAVRHDRGMQNESSHPEDTPLAGERVRHTPDAGGAGASVGAPGKPAGPRTRPVATRTAGAWIGLVVGALILIVLLVFILQNNTSTAFSIFFWDFSLPLGVSMLFAAIAGALIMALVGGARILQLRKAYKNRKH